MTLTLDLPAADEAALRELAARNGQAPDVWARDALSEVLRTRRASSGANGSNGRHAPAHEDGAAQRLAALEAAVETARGFAASPGALKEPLSDWALSRAGAYDAQ